MAAETDEDHDRSTLRWVLLALAALALVALLAYDRGEPGVGERTPDREESLAVVIEV